MLPFFLKRLFWAVPTLIVVSLASFYFLSFVPDPTDEPGAARQMGRENHARLRRERFLDLPTFVNVTPLDVRERAKAATQSIIHGDEAERREGERELVRLGAAAFPQVIPSLDSFGPSERTAIAVALAPIAERMRIPNAESARREDLAGTFWTRFWADRGVEFQRSTARTLVERLAHYRTESRLREVEQLDTFVMPDVLARLEPPQTEDAVDEARTLVEVLAHVTGVDDRIRERATLEDARAVVRRWKTFWFVYGTDFVTLDGTARISAAILDTRYAKWGYSVITAFRGDTSSPTLRRIRDGSVATLAIVFGAIGLAYACAIVLGMVSAASRKTYLDVGVACIVLGLYAAPTALIAVLTHGAIGSPKTLILPIIIVAMGIVAAPTRHQRSALLNALNADYARAARARGASNLRVLLVHGARTALLPLVTLATLEPPMALGATFVVERVFAIRGLGEMTIEAVNLHDVDFLMALSIMFSAIAILLVVITDIGHALIDPRLRHRLARGRA